MSEDTWWESDGTDLMGEVEREMERDIDQYYIETIIDYIKENIDENGELPDDDCIIEGMGVPDGKWDLVNKAYHIYYIRSR